MSRLLIAGFGSTRPSAAIPALRASLKLCGLRPSFTQIENVKHTPPPSSSKIIRIAVADSVAELALSAKDIDSSFSAIICFDSPIHLLTVSDLIAQDFDPSDKWSLPSLGTGALSKATDKLAKAIAQSLAEKASAGDGREERPITLGPVTSLVEVVDRNTRPSLIGPMSGLLYTMQPMERAKIRESIALWLLGKTDVKTCLKSIGGVAAKHNIAKAFSDLETFLLANHEIYEKEFSAGNKKKTTRKGMKTTRKGITIFEAEFLRRLVAGHNK
jgi:hypothetical protein